MEKLNRWWVVLISLAMIAFGGVVIWSLFSPVPQWEFMNQMIAAIVMASVGACALVMEIKYQPEDRAPSIVALALGPYLAAWSKLWRTKWLLWIYGVIAASLVLGEIAWRVVSHVRYIRSAHPDASAYHHVFSFWDVLWRLSFSLDNLYDKFLPSLAYMYYGFPILAVVLFCLVWWLLPRLQRMSSDPELSGKTGLFSTCLVVAALCGVLQAVFTFAAARWAWTHLGYDQHTRDVLMRWTFYQQILGYVMMPVLTASMMGGIIGSLARNAQGEANVKATFLPDAVRYFLPLVVLYLVIDAAFLLPGLTMNATNAVMTGTARMVFQSAISLLGLMGVASTLLMFAPFGIVTHGLGARVSVLHSLDVWRRRWKQTITLIAVGSFFLGLVTLIVRLPADLISAKMSLWSIPLGTLETIVRLGIRVVILLAIWEFYQANVIDQESASVTESSPSP